MSVRIYSDSNTSDAVSKPTMQDIRLGLSFSVRLFLRGEPTQLRPFLGLNTGASCDVLINSTAGKIERNLCQTQQ